ncbi:hypothetical protein L2737_10620 [Shewanella electrodiphila]|uniref:Uncharacterized protein n=1 Tax=Shewanella electrodiphila TaxID=934143 RepID=A0ABT0KPK2_9GAMM|nr:hypothetical protein [Shewanella electrodiphila]MCL1045777.1 hypothetical protein [Shewanella electrodiphila]
MKLTFGALLLFFSMQLLADDSPSSILDSLLGKCINESSSVCESVLVGDTAKEKILLSFLDAMKSSAAFEELYVKTYGKKKYAELIDAYSLTISPLTSSDFQLQGTTATSATFLGADNTTLSIIKIQTGWVIDLENSTFSLGGESGNHDLLEFVSLLSGAHSHLIQLIKNNSAEKEVFKKGGLYYLASIYHLVPDAQKPQLEVVFKENNSDVASVIKELLTAINN